MSVRRGLTLLVVQLLLVLSIGAKYAWERHTSPTVWARAGQWDPAQPLRGRYISLTVHASACGLPPGGPGSFVVGSLRPMKIGMPAGIAQAWNVVPAVTDGVLAPRVVVETKPGPIEQLTLDAGMPCEYARLSGTSDFYIPEHAKSPLPLLRGQELWVLVTVPPSGPVRPVKLAISDSSGFHVLNLD